MNQLDQALDRLVAEGVLDREQAGTVRRTVAGAVPDREQAGAAAGDVPDRQQAVREGGTVAATAPPRRVSAVAETLGYLGGTLAAVSAMAIASEFWVLLTAGAQVGVVTLASGVLWGAGQSIRGSVEPAGRRLVGVLWLLSTVAATTAAGIAAHDLAGLEPETVALAGGLTAVLHGGLLWRATGGALQQVPVFAGLVATVLAGLEHAASPPEEWFGLVTWALAVAWGALAWGRVVQPVRTAYALAAIGALCGAEALIWSHETTGLLLGLGTVVALFGGAALTDIGRGVLAGFGIAGAAFVVPQALNTWFGDSIGAPVVLFVSGIVLLAGVLVTVRGSRTAAAVGDR